MKIYAMSDIHGYLEEFERALSFVDLSGDNKLILLGDYVHGPNGYGVLDKIIALEETYGSEKVIVLMGNHEEMAINGDWPVEQNEDKEKAGRCLRWMYDLRRYYVVGNTIFVHAGINEKAEDLWELGTGEDMFIWKYPAKTGKFYGDLKIVAGHVGTAEICKDSSFHDIYYDGASHYYIDGTVQESGSIPVIMVDIETAKYYQVDENGERIILPYCK